MNGPRPVAQTATGLVDIATGLAVFAQPDDSHRSRQPGRWGVLCDRYIR